MRSSTVNPVGGEQRVLLVSGDVGCQDHLRSILEADGFRVEPVARIEDACHRMPVLDPGIVIADLHPRLGPDWNTCHQLLARMQGLPEPPPLILLTDGGPFDSVAELLRRGAADFLTKPFSAEDLLRRVEVALLLEGKPREARGPAGPPASGSVGAAAGPRNGGRGAPSAQDLRGGKENPLPLDLLVGRGEAMRLVIEQVRLVAPKRTTVLVTGETGTGKERVARAIHALSQRCERPMVSVNCGGIPPNLLEDEFFGHVKGAFTDAYQNRVGRFEQAHRGTIFLDEIGDLPLELQPKLLRVLQEREIHRVGAVDPLRVDARVIAATNVDLWNRVAAGGFREDLFYRINVFPIHLPPLRERREDIPLFVERFVRQFCRRDNLAPKQLDPSAEAELMARPWPGNIRELENAVEIAVIRSQDRRVIELRDFPEPRGPWRPGPPASPFEDASAAGLKQIVGRFERDLIQRVLEQTNGNKTQAAELLGLKRTTLIEKLKKFEHLQDPRPSTQGS